MIRENVLLESGHEKKYPIDFFDLCATTDLVQRGDRSNPAQIGIRHSRPSARHVLNLPIYMAHRHGIFESEGFDYKPITTKTNTAIAALVSGDLDYITAFNSGLGAAIGGAPLVAT